MNQSLPSETDIFVVGGGPAGLAVAIAARRKGFRVMVADGAQPPIDKACGEGLLPDGLAALHALGIQVPAADSSAFRGVRFVGSRLSADAVFPAGGCGMAVRRTALHPLITQRAEQAGVELLWRACVTGIAADGVHLDNHFVRARWIVGADGARSRVRQWAGLDHGPRTRLRYAFRRHYGVKPWTDHMEVYWGERCQGYATAVSADEVCVAVASQDSRLRSEEALRELPSLGARLRGAEAVSAERGALTGNRKFHGVCRGNVALVGDASGTVDAITGEGLGLGFSQAVALADSFVSGDLSTYQAEHRRLALRPWWMARLMLMLDGRPRLQHRVLRTFQARPEIFQHFLALHVGNVPPAEIVWDGLTLGWSLLTA
ncbi:MAG: NAD(P)/FAD-dependent oxidoreductase [Candidatus Sulfotelmatobacter sp.]